MIQKYFSKPDQHIIAHFEGPGLWNQGFSGELPPIGIRIV
jgi:hypothetical protein